jgi:translation initiation factor 1 (eIF-1/SUI1)
MIPFDEAVALSEPLTFRLEDQQDRWLAASWPKGAERKLGTVVAVGPTPEAAVKSLVRKLKKRVAT